MDSLIPSRLRRIPRESHICITLSHVRGRSTNPDRQVGEHAVNHNQVRQHHHYPQHCGILWNWVPIIISTVRRFARTAV